MGRTLELIPQIWEPTDKIVTTAISQLFYAAATTDPRTFAVTSEAILRYINSQRIPAKELCAADFQFYEGDVDKFIIGETKNWNINAENYSPRDRSVLLTGIESIASRFGNELTVATGAKVPVTAYIFDGKFVQNAQSETLPRYCRLNKFFIPTY